MPVECGFEDCHTFQLTNPCSTGVKPVGGKVNEFTARVSTQTCGRLAQGLSGRMQAELLETILSWRSLVTTPEQILDKTTDLKIRQAVGEQAVGDR